MEKADAIFSEHVHIAHTARGPTHYEPSTDAERALDKALNRKLDFIVLSILAIDFIVSSL